MNDGIKNILKKIENVDLFFMDKVEELRKEMKLSKLEFIHEINKLSVFESFNIDVYNDYMDHKRKPSSAFMFSVLKLKNNSHE